MLNKVLLNIKFYTVTIIIPILIAFLVSKFIFSIYTIDNISMNNTLFHGDKVIINKFQKKYPRQSIIVFEKSGVSYVKRIIGLPGDLVQIKNDKVYVNNYFVDEPSSILFTNEIIKNKNAFDQEVFFKYSSFWNIYNFGVIKIPYKGMKIRINKDNIKIYKSIFEYENNDASFILVNSKSQFYTVKKDYFFVMGDNRHKSVDSRRMGFIDEESVIGRVNFILFSTRSNSFFRGVLPRASKNMGQ